MDTLEDKKLPKFCQNSAFKFTCKICDYNTSKKSSFDSHILSAKHQRMTKDDAGGQNSAKILPLPKETFFCSCGKEYQHRQGLWKHKKICDISSENSIVKNTELTDKDLIVMLINENKELKTLMLEQQGMMIKVIENGTQNNSVNTTNNHTNSHNKAFNLNFFLNETCKEAMNIGDFVDSLKMELSDLERVGEKGYIEGITSIIVKNLKALDITKRPVHCTDKKRETIYIKDDNKWEKDEDKSHMHKLIKRVVSKNMKLFSKFKEKHPDCMTYHSKFGDQYHKIVYESMGGKGDNDFEKNEKIIKNVLKEVVVDKNI